ncbi:hypothetical protein IFO70_32790 [Phormidium tenue FACHB-886]|nr:hypothetical protein [Phormidium tenue FACHB-886]
MQAFLTVAAEFVAVAGFALFAVRFAIGLIDRHSHTAVEVVPDVQIDGDELAAELAQIAAEVLAESAPTPIADAVVPFARRPIDLTQLSIRRLKAIASATKLPRYNQDTKARLAERLLSEVPVWTLREAIAV